MPWCALVAQGANRCLPLSVAFCDAAPRPPLYLSLLLSLTSPVSLSSASVYVLAYFLCWFSVGKCQVRLCLRGFWQMGWSTKQRRGGADTQSAPTVQLSACVRISFCSDARPRVCTCVCVRGPGFCLESHKRHQSCQSICIASKNRGHAMLIYDRSNPRRVKQADATQLSEAFTF